MTFIVLFSTNGTTILKYSDDKPTDGPGDIKANTLNSFLTYTFTEPGTYYIRVGEFNAYGPYGGVLSTDATYHLHISTIPIQSDAHLLNTLLPLFANTRKHKE